MSSLKQTEQGFSLLELLIAMVVTLTLMTAGTTLLTSALRDPQPREPEIGCAG